MRRSPGKETSQRRSASGWKLWDRFNNCEILDNVVDMNAQAWSPAVIRCTAGNREAPQQGTIRVVGNTMYGATTEGMLVLRPQAAFKHEGFVIRNNIFYAVSEPKRLIVTNYRPTDFRCDGNVYSDGAFEWGGKPPVPFARWKELSGQDRDSKVGTPQFMAIEHGDFHLRPSDTVAIGTGVAEDRVNVDFDGDQRSPAAPVAGADVPSR